MPKGKQSPIANDFLKKIIAFFKNTNLRRFSQKTFAIDTPQHVLTRQQKSEEKRNDKKSKYVTCYVALTLLRKRTESDYQMYTKISIEALNPDRRPFRDFDTECALSEIDFSVLISKVNRQIVSIAISRSKAYFIRTNYRTFSFTRKVRKYLRRYIDILSSSSECPFQANSLGYSLNQFHLTSPIS